MSAHARRAEVALPLIITSDEEWAGQIAKPGLRVIDIYAKWAGVCEPMQNIFKHLKIEHGENVCFLQAQSDHVEALKNLRNKSCPTFLFIYNGMLVKMIRGANVPLIEKTIKDQLDIEKAGQTHHQIIFDDMGAQILSGPLLDGVQSDPSGCHGSETDGSNFSRSNILHDVVSTSTAQNQSVASSFNVESTNMSPGFDTPDSPVLEKTLALIKPDAMSPGTLSQILEIIRINRFEIVNRKKIWMSDALAREVYKEHVDKPFFLLLVTYLTSGPTLALILKKENAVLEWRNIMGPSSFICAKEEAPKSIRAQFGTDSRLNAVFGSDSSSSAKYEIDLLFGESATPMTLPFDEAAICGMPKHIQKTLMIIKPDATSAQYVDGIIERVICCGFNVVKREEIMLSVEMVHELYPTLVDQDNCQDVVDHLISSPVIALVLKGDEVVAGLCELLGPEDPVEAKERYPMSIRALFGVDRIKNAAHGSSSPENALHDIHLIFPHILKRSGSNIFGYRPGTAFASQPPSRTQSHAQLQDHLERTLAIIKPDAYPLHKESIITRIKSEGFAIIKDAEVHFTIEQAQDFYKEHIDKPFYSELTMWMSSTPIYALVLEKSNGVGSWRELAGPTDSFKAKERSPTSIRGMYGTDGSHNAVHGSDSPASAKKEIMCVFGDTVSAYPDALENTLALIKPDAYPDKRDAILARIREDGFVLVKEAEVVLSLEKAQEFYREHQGKPFYETLVSWMSSAPIYAIVLSRSGAIKKWRELAGPTNSEKARENFPTSIRALYGKNGSENAVHGSDSALSARREIGVIFGEEFAELLYATEATTELHKEIHKSDLLAESRNSSLSMSKTTVPLSSNSTEIEKVESIGAYEESKEHTGDQAFEATELNHVAGSSTIMEIDETSLDSSVPQLPLEPRPPSGVPSAGGSARVKHDSEKRGSRLSLSHEPSTSSLKGGRKSSVSKSGILSTATKGSANLGSENSLRKPTTSVPSSATKSRAKINESKTNISASKPSLRGSQANVGKQDPNISGSKSGISEKPTKVNGSNAKINESKTNISATKSPLKVNGSNAKINESKTNISASKPSLRGSQANVGKQDPNISGSKSGISEKPTKVNGSNAKISGGSTHDGAITGEALPDATEKTAISHSKPVSQANLQVSESIAMA
ncbi:hypothetical protein BASA62_004940 [Batrachochytrium salamandrivorans]|nr:hypothetical protein BASA62_004940 [Batrachochytrium salamandrivorans]